MWSHFYTIDFTGFATIWRLVVILLHAVNLQSFICRVHVDLDSQAPIVSQASTCQALPTANHSGYSPILSKDAIEPPNLLLALKSKDVKVKIFTKPLINGTTCSQNKVSANEEEQLDKLLEHNINFLAERLRNTRDILVLLHHFGVITYNDQMRLVIT